MKNYDDEFLYALELEDTLPGTTEAQKEANVHRRRLYLHLMNKKPNDVKSIYTDLSQEMHMNRALNPSYRLSVSDLM
ncbi:hypothetical protein [Paenibacillus chungangensis]|uniref:Uncharacterized protein n=1 Tax=Paenibacillus chungangensis TaxID=696535 RepID=A0ABW3HKG5_9BACL